MTIEVLGREILIASHVLSRRELRKAKLFIYDGETRYRATDRVPLSDTPRRLTIRKQTFEVSVGAPPLIALHKPIGWETSTKSQHHVTVFDGASLPTSLKAVGRLDVDTQGLLLLTADGALLQRLTHPRRSVERVYEAGLARPLASDYQARAAEGVTLRDGHVASADVIPLDGPSRAWSASETAAHWYRITLRSGRYHEVRRLIAALGSHVLVLARTHYGPVALGDLAAGEHRSTLAEPVYAAVGLSAEPTLHVVPATP